MSRLVETSYKKTARAMLADRRSDLATFTDEWITAAKKAGLIKIDHQIRVLADAYSQELERLIRDAPGSREWTEVLEVCTLLRAATFDDLLKLQPRLKTSLPISGPESHSRIADKTYAFLVDAGFQFGSSLGELRKSFPANVQIGAWDI